MITEWREDALLNATRNAVKEASFEGAGFVAHTARVKVKQLTGTLAGQISVRVSKFKDGGYAVWAQGKGDYKKYYASFVELGTFKDPKQPFLRPALKANKKKIFQNYQDKMVSASIADFHGAP